MKVKIEILNRDGEQMLVSYKEPKIEKMYIVTGRGDKISIKKKKDIFFFIDLFLILGLFLGIAVCMVGFIFMVISNDIRIEDICMIMSLLVILIGFIWILEVRPKQYVLKYINGTDIR